MCVLCYSDSSLEYLLVIYHSGFLGIVDKVSPKFGLKLG